MASVQAKFWCGKRVLLTGHTGFKGSWMSLWLQSMGAQVHGLALEPSTAPALFHEARVVDAMAGSVIGDIRGFDIVLDAMRQARPDVVIHMAAQPLVRYSYAAPVETYATNVMGTVHVLEAARQVGTARAIVNVTTDKCYENSDDPLPGSTGQPRGSSTPSGFSKAFDESDPMGGYDPYSSSKGCSELVTSAYRRSYFQHGGIALASARAGNVIGGGDWSADRLVPDILRSFEQRQPVLIRHPAAVRPWQHVLEPLGAYLVLAERLFESGQAYAQAWNFGPEHDDARAVEWIVRRMADLWGSGATWRVDGGSHPHEAQTLRLDITKARQRLAWRPRWNLETALLKTVEWHRAWLDGVDARQTCLQQIRQFESTSGNPT